MLCRRSPLGTGCLISTFSAGSESENFFQRGLRYFVTRSLTAPLADDKLPKLLAGFLAVATFALNVLVSEHFISSGGITAAGAFIR